MKSVGIGFLILIVAAISLSGQRRDYGARARPAPASMTTVDCADKSSRCPELLIEGSSAARLPNGEPSPFRGFADPSMRNDPATGRLWLAYSWPNMHAAGDGTGGRRRGLFGGGRGADLADRGRAGGGWPTDGCAGRGHQSRLQHRSRANLAVPGSAMAFG